MLKVLHPRDDIDSIWEEKKKEEDSPTLKIAWIQQFRYEYQKEQIKTVYSSQYQQY